MRVVKAPGWWQEASTQCAYNSVGLHLSWSCRLWLKTCPGCCNRVSLGLEGRFQPSPWSPLLPLRFVSRSRLCPGGSESQDKQAAGCWWREIWATDVPSMASWPCGGHNQEWLKPSCIIQGFSLRDPCNDGLQEQEGWAGCILGGVSPSVVTDPCMGLTTTEVFSAVFATTWVCQVAYGMGGVMCSLKSCFWVNRSVLNSSHFPF